MQLGSSMEPKFLLYGISFVFIPYSSPGQAVKLYLSLLQLKRVVGHEHKMHPSALLQRQASPESQSPSRLISWLCYMSEMCHDRGATDLLHAASPFQDAGERRSPYLGYVIRTAVGKKQEKLCDGSSHFSSLRPMSRPLKCAG